MPRNARGTGARRPHPKPDSRLADKRGRINRELFNFLENLLIFRTMPELTVPPESSVKFRITRQASERGVCLLIHIDSQDDPIFESAEVRPDYLAIYLHGSGCICTIIEMKSKGSRDLKHGLMQIKALADRLRQEFRDCLPPRFRLHIQGVLLCQPNADVPGARMAQMAHEGLTIVPVQSAHRAELFPYISRLNTLPQTPFKDTPRSPDDPSPLEFMLSRCSLRVRLPLLEAKAGTGTQRAAALHLCYAVPEPAGDVTWTTRGRHCVLLVRERGTALTESLRRDVEANGLTDKFLVESL